MTTSMSHNQDRYLPGCRLAPPVPKNDMRTALTCALKHAVHLSRYEQLNGSEPGVRRFASAMHRQPGPIHPDVSAMTQRNNP